MRSLTGHAPLRATRVSRMRMRAGWARALKRLALISYSGASGTDVGTGSFHDSVGEAVCGCTNLAVHHSVMPVRVGERGASHLSGVVRVSPQRCRPNLTSTVSVRGSAIGPRAEGLAQDVR